MKKEGCEGSILLVKMDNPHLEAISGSTPKLSVVVPVYKVEKYLRECVESILSQTFKDFELILVDDGSPDRCGEICDELAKKDPRIRVFHQKNGGVNSARKLGVEHARGEWITFVDSDDLLPKDALKELFDKATDDTDWVQGMVWDFNEVPEKGSLRRNDIKEAFSLTECAVNVFNSLLGPWGKIVRKRLFSPDVLDIPRDIRIDDDLLMNIRLVANIPRHPKAIRSTVYCYRTQTQGSMSKSYVPSEQYALRYSRLLLAELEKFPAESKKAIERAMSKLLHNDMVREVLRSGEPIKSPRGLALIIRPIAKEKLQYFFSYACLALGCPQIAQARIKISMFLHRRKTDKNAKTLLK